MVLPEEQAVVREVARLPLVVRQACEDCEPSLLARALLDLAAAFSRWYTAGNQDRAKRVLVEGDAALQQARLALTDAVRIALANGLRLLGLQTPSEL